MTAVEKIAQVLRDAGAAYVEFDDSATDGNCWIVEQKDAWFEGVAEAVLAVLDGPEISRPGFHVEDCQCLERDGAVLNVDLRCDIP